ncbi:MAG: 16S rRNA (cytosine(1402)-N(4))-methyltransferase RsmH [Phycisphaerales bacterium]|nr:16S rRNA (cytosine(1402)-N(4))-methyltransferase RsmH [Phycisphaerales bacterium]
MLDPQPGQVVLDGTIKLGGHAAAILPRITPGGLYIGLDWDERMLAQARDRLRPEWDAHVLKLYAASYADFPEVLAQAGVESVDHMLLDLGINSAQLDDPTRGFSFEREGPLDMRFDAEGETQAVDLVNKLSETDLANVLYELGGETHSRRIAKRICQARHSRRIVTTAQLARIVESAIGRSGRIHPATKTFQALRIAVNRELENLERFLEQTPQYLKPGGKLAVISFHSLEDGAVKRFLKSAKKSGTFEELTKRPVVADTDERDENPRSRSAKLRVAVRVESQ